MCVIDLQDNEIRLEKNWLNYFLSTAGLVAFIGFDLMVDMLRFY